MNAPAETPVIHGRCGCGGKFRVRNATANTVVACPRCGRPITIFEADIRAAWFEIPLASSAADTTQIPDAVLIDVGELRLADVGSRPGLTGRQAPAHEEAQLIRAGSYELGISPQASGAGAAARRARSAGARRSFAADVFASFTFANSPGNALNVLSTAGVSGVVLHVAMLLPGPLRLAAIGVVILLLIYTMQFLWSVLRGSANGDDEIPWTPTDWELFDDVFKPALVLAVVSIACSLPSWILVGQAPASIVTSWAAWALLAIGWLPWPIAVLSLALGNSVEYLRPDWMIRCVVAIGPAYLLAWAACMLTIQSWYWVFAVGPSLVYAPAIAIGVTMYLGYVTFRIVGVMFHHFGTRFPWPIVR